MILLTHVVIALISVAHSSYIFFAPSAKQLRVSLGLVAMTLASGTFLVVSSGSHVLDACLAGLFYIGFVSIGITSTWYKLAHEKVRP